MLFIDRLKHRPLVLLLAGMMIVILTTIDYFTGAELSFSIFYLIPISLLALNKTSNKTLILSIAFLAAIGWFFADVNTKEYSTVLFSIWNAFVRLIIFCSIGVLIFHFREKHEALNEKNSELIHMNNEKNKFIGIAAHDLRNPISGIYSFSDLLLNDTESKMNKEELEIVQHIKSLSENILDLIKNLLDISKIESGQIEITFIKQDYVSFIKKQVNFNRLLAKQKEIGIYLYLQKEQIIAEFDEHLMSQVVNNLLSNAIKYSEINGNITINVTEEDGEILTEVIDHSKGIPLEEQQKLFNYFQKTSTKPTDGETSTGLGLAIVKKIITACNGTIGVKSNIGEGSNFYFTFPIER